MGRVCATHREDQRALEALLAAADTARPHSPISVRRLSGQPLIVDAVPIGDGLTGRKAILLLLNDPAYPARGSAGLSLQLLGLTPAEARIAELVGSGLSPRETAGEVDNSEGTVRTSLARVYQKLGINRQAELARLVTRLELGGAT
jgi:DNA-binding CsgD family transcriptional regulator